MAQAKSILALLQERLIQRWKRTQPMPVAQVTTTQRKKLPSPPALHSRAHSLTTLISPTQHSMSTTHRGMKVQLRKRDKKVRRRKKKSGSPRKLKLVTRGGFIPTRNLLIFDLQKTKCMFLVLSKIFVQRQNPEAQTTTSR